MAEAPTVLGRICAEKRKQVAEQKNRRPIQELLKRAQDQAPPRGFAAALERDVARRGVGLIAEIKKASPSAGVIRANFEPGQLARAYQRGGYADAAIKVQQLWVAGRRDEAIAAVPDELALRTGFVGTDDMVLARFRAYRDAGVNTVRLRPDGDTVTARLDNLARGLDLIRRLEEE